MDQPSKTPPLNEEVRTPVGRTVADTVDALAEFHHEHYRQATPLQQAVDWVTERLGRPGSALVILAALAGWTIYAAVAAQGRVDAPAFAWLELTGTLMALVFTSLILVTQRREDHLAERRAKLTLELALLADRKSSKLIALFEASRQADPALAHQVDEEIQEMAVPADPKNVLAAIDERTTKPTQTSQT